MAEPWLTKAEVARELKVSTRTITRLAPPCIRVGGQNRYHLSQVEAALRGVPQEGGNVLQFPGNRERGVAA